MEPVDQSRAHRVSPGRQAAAIDHPLRARLLLACARRGRSLGEIAREMGEPLPKLHYHMARLMRAGLVRVSRVARRPGRPIRYYQAIADAFLVNLANVSQSPVEKLARELREALDHDVNRRELALLYHPDDADQMRVRLVEAGGQGRSSRAFIYCKALRLTAGQRTALAADLAAVIARYEEKQAAGRGEAFLVQAAFAPRRPPKSAAAS